MAATSIGKNPPAPERSVRGAAANLGGEPASAFAPQSVDSAVPDSPSEQGPSLSPSRAADFKSCPQLYKYRAIDRLPEPPSPPAVRGTLVHAVLEQLFDLPPGERTLATAVGLLPSVWQRVRALDPDAVALSGAWQESEPGAEAAWLASAEALLAAYFGLEDPARYQPAGRELKLETTLDGGLVVRGVLDRLDEAPDGRLRVVDYKTGRSPNPGFEAAAMFQLRFYAVLLQRTRGVVPAVLRLMYLGDSTFLEYAPSEAELKATERVLTALSEAIETARVTDDWHPSPGARCGWCPFADICPAGPGTNPRTIDDPPVP